MSVKDGSLECVDCLVGGSGTLMLRRFFSGQVRVETI